MTIGVDLGDVWSHYCTLNQDGEVVDRGRFRTTPKAIGKWFTDLPPTRVAMEAGVHSIWISEQLQELGHEVIVANVRELRAISHSDRKSDQVDAEKLARYARLDPNILRPISHRTVEQQEALTLIRARELLVRLRSQSGEHDPQLGITKVGNAYLRSLLIECANHILRPHGRYSALRQWGVHLAGRGGKQAKSKAAVAVARTLAVLLHRIWTTQEPYLPFHAKAA